METRRADSRGDEQAAAGASSTMSVVPPMPSPTAAPPDLAAGADQAQGVQPPLPVDAPALGVPSVAVPSLTLPPLTVPQVNVPPVPTIADKVKKTV